MCPVVFLENLILSQHSCQANHFSGHIIII
ncbi:hypothetical protein PHET_07776 [Paragonimus heterotremus]|uniref:Uncharacterized protein n=1 Tax=Paragonimus heterotremus TaxID=100268 RepID=A0A8J4TCU2_9TREM|nr:hypothetical protein PHET_07776 [Paragonimus heterotremus]